MADHYFIFRLVELAGSRHRKIYLYRKGKWGPAKAKAMRGSLLAMRAMAKSLKDGYPYLIIERLIEKDSKG